MAPDDLKVENESLEDMPEEISDLLNEEQKPDNPHFANEDS